VTPSHPTVAAITLNPTGGGIAAASDLLWRASRQHWGPRTSLLTMFGHENRPASFGEKARFWLSAATAQAFGQTDWILFCHLGLARVQHGVPARLRRPYAVFLHGIEAWQALDDTLRWALSAAELRIANSRYTAARVREAHPGVGRIDICPLALPSAPGSVHEESAPFTIGPHVVLVVGRMIAAEAYKGHDQLIDAWPLVVTAVPDAQLVIVGDGDDASRLKQKALANPAAAGILFTGFVSRGVLEGLYARAALFALPSRGEGFGLVYLEAMAHRLPCVASIHDAAGEVVIDGETGRLVDQSDIDTLAGTIIDLLGDDAQRRRLGGAGWARVAKEFTFERFSDRVHALLPGRSAIERALTVEA
jgi:phosphatidyl-myo-inositol dimannoside synthase